MMNGTGQRHVLVVAGADSSGGAGLVRDLETLAQLGVKACLAVTAVTVQTHEAVNQVEMLDPALVSAQMRAALSCNPVGAIKIGMLGNAGIIGAVEAVLAEHPACPVVLDPVLVSSSGRALLRPANHPALRRLLLRATLVTPNLPELATLTGMRQAQGEAEAVRQAETLLSEGVRAVLVKGGHGEGPESVDVLVHAEGCQRFAARRLPVSMRGTGCALASAIASGLANGKDLPGSIAAARHYLQMLLEQQAA